MLVKIACNKAMYTKVMYTKVLIDNFHEKYINIVNE